MTAIYIDSSGIPAGRYETDFQMTPEGGFNVYIEDGEGFGGGVAGYGPDYATALDAAIAELASIFEPAPEEVPAEPEPVIIIDVPAFADPFSFNLNLGSGALAPTGGMLDA